MPNGRLSPEAASLIRELSGVEPQNQADFDAKRGTSTSRENPYADIMEAAAEQYGLDPRLLESLARAESGFNPQAVSQKGAQGLFQFIPETAQAMGVDDPFDPYQATMGGARYVRELIDRFGSPDLAIAAYNAGPENVMRYGGIPPFPETQEHVRKVMAGAGGTPTPSGAPAPGASATASGRPLSPAAMSLIQELKRPSREIIPRVPRRSPLDMLQYQGVTEEPLAEQVTPTPYTVADRMSMYQMDMTPSTPQALAKESAARPEDDAMAAGQPPPAGGAGSTFLVKPLRPVDREAAIARMEAAGQVPEPPPPAGAQPTPLSMYPGVIARGVEQAMREGVAGIGAVGIHGPGLMTTAPLQALGLVKPGVLEATGAEALRMLTEPEPGTPVAEFEKKYEPVGAMAHVASVLGNVIGYAMNPIMRGTGKPGEVIAEKILGRTTTAAARAAAGFEQAFQQAVVGASERKAARAAAAAKFAVESTDPQKYLVARWLAQPATHGFIFGVLATAPEKDETPLQYASRALVQGGVTAPMFAFFSISTNALLRAVELTFGSDWGRKYYGSIASSVLKKNRTGEPLTPEELTFAKWIVEEARRRGFDVNLVPRDVADPARERMNRRALPAGPPAPMALPPGPEPAGLLPPLPWRAMLPAGRPPGARPLLDISKMPSPIQNIIYEARAKGLQKDHLLDWQPWITEQEIKDTQESDWPRLVEVAKARMAAYREAELIRLATPEEQAMLQDPRAPKALILKAIEDRLAQFNVALLANQEARPAYTGAGATPVSGVVGQGALPAALWTAEGAPAPPSAVTPAAPPRLAPAPAPPSAAPVAPAAPPAIPAPEPGGPSEQEYGTAIDELKKLLEAPPEPIPAPGPVAPRPAIPLPAGPVQRAGPAGSAAAEPPFAQERRLREEAANYDESVEVAARQLMKRMENVHGEGAVDTFLQLSYEDRAKMVGQLERRFKAEDNPDLVADIVRAIDDLATEDLPVKGPDRRGGAEALARRRSTILGNMPTAMRSAFARPIKSEHIRQYDTSGSLVARLSKRDPGLWVAEDGRGIDEAAEQAGVKIGDVIGMLERLASRPKGRTQPAGIFDKPDPDLQGGAKRMQASQLQKGDFFIAHDGNGYDVINRTENEIIVQYYDHVAQELKLASLRPSDIVPYIHHEIRGGAGPQTTSRFTLPTTRGPGQAMALPPSDAWEKAPQSTRSHLLTAGIYHYVRGSKTASSLEEALEKQLGPAVRPFVPGLLAKIQSLPAFTEGAPRGPVAPQPSPGGPPGAPGGPGLQPAPPPGRGPVREPPPPGPEAPQPPPEVAPPAPRPEERPAKPERRPQPPEKPRTEVGEPNRQIRDGGVATPNYDLYPEVRRNYFTPETVDKYEKQIGKRPLPHQIENANRALAAFEKKHSYLIADNTGTGKTLSAGLILDVQMGKNPESRIIYLVKNHDLRRQAFDDVLKPMRMKMRDYASDGDNFKPGKRQVNFITYNKLQQLYSSGGLLKTIGDFRPDIIVIDESQELRNWYVNTKTALAGELIQRVDPKTRSLFMSATPYESILHTGYLSSLNLWYPKQNWVDYLVNTMGVQWDEVQGNWIGLSPKKLKLFYENMIRTGRMTRSEIDFHTIKDRKGNPLKLTVKMRMVPMDASQEIAWTSTNAFFDDLLEDFQEGPERRMINGLRYLFLRALDESQKVDKAIELAREAKKRGMMPVITTFFRGDIDPAEWLEEVAAGERKYKRETTKEIVQRIADEGIKVSSPVTRLAQAFPDFVHITGAQPSGAWARKFNLEAVRTNEAPGAILTMAAGGTGISAHDTGGKDGKTLKPRVQINLSLPDTAMTMDQVSGRTFRLGSQSNAIMFWLYNDTPSQRKKANVVGHKNKVKGAAVEGMEENPTADEIIDFDFPEVNDPQTGLEGARRIPGQGDLFPGGPVPPALPKKSPRLRYKGFQEGTAKMAGFHLWDLEQDIPGHPRGSTISSITLEREGYAVPEPPPQAELPGTTPSESDIIRRQIEAEVLERQRKAAEQKLKPLEPGAKPQGPLLEAPGTKRKQEKLPTGEGAVAAAEPYRQQPPFHGPVSAGGTGTTTKSPRRMILDAAKKLRVMFHRGRMRASKNVLAYYLRQWDVIRARVAADTEVFSHEIGHRIDKMLFGLDMSNRSPVMQQFGAELRRIATPPYTISEGLAEFIRRYVTEPQKAQAEAPSFYVYWDALMNAPMPRRPSLIDRATMKAQDWQAARDTWMRGRIIQQIRDALFGLREDWERWREATPMTRIQATQESGVTASGRWHRGMTSLDFEMALWDDFAPYRRFADQMQNLAATAERPLDLSQINPQVFASTIHGRWGKALYFLKYGTYSWNTPGRVKGEPLFDIIDDIGADFKNFEGYWKARRAKDLEKMRGWDAWETVGIRKEDIEPVLRDYGTPERRKLVARAQKYADSSLDILVESGMMKPETKLEINKLNRDYAPLMRFFEGDDTDFVGFMGVPSGQWGNLWSPVKAIHGSQRSTIYGLESLAKMTLLIMDRAEKNDLARRFTEMARMAARTGAEGIGEIAEPVPKEQWPIEFTVQQAVAKINGVIKKKYPGTPLIDIGTLGWPDKLLTEILQIFQPAIFQPKKPYMWIWKDGVREYWRFHPEVFDAIMRLDVKEGNLLMNWAKNENALLRLVSRGMTVGQRLLRKGAVVFSTRLWLRSMFRDIPTAMLYTDSLPRFIQSMAVTGLDALTRAELTQKYYAGGGHMAGFIGMRPDEIAKYVNREMFLARNPDWRKRWRAYAANTIRAYVAIGESMELWPRLAEARVQGLPGAVTRAELTKAAYAGREATQDFMRLGLLPRFLTSMAAFYGPNMGGWERFFREFRNHPMRFPIRLFTLVAVPSLLYYFYQRTDKRWKNWPQEDRDSHFIIFLPESLKAALPKEAEWVVDAPLRFPKPYEAGYVGTLIERTLQAIDEKNPELMERLAKNMYDESPLNPWNMAPTTLLPMVELWGNWDTSFERPIRPEKGEPFTQSWAWTTETAKGMGKQIDMSPAAIEHLVSGYGGTVGRNVLRAADQVGALTGGIPKALPETQPADLPIIGTFFGRTGKLVSEPAERFYTYLKKAREARETLRILGQRGQTEEAKQYIEEHRVLLELAGDLEKVSRQIQPVTEEYYRVREAADLTSEQKHREMKELSDLRANALREVLDRIEMRINMKPPEQFWSPPWRRARP